MATAGDVVTGALRYIQYQSAFEPVSAEDMDVGIETLNDMMAAWANEGIRLGYRPVTSSSDYITAPNTAILGMKQNLGLMLSPMFRTADSANMDLRADARKSKQGIKSLTVTIPEAMRPSTLPRGSGNQWHGEYDFDFYGGEDSLAIAEFRFEGNATAESLTANTPTTFSGITWTTVTSDGFTASNGTAKYKYNGITSAEIEAQVLIRATDASQVTLYVARNNEYIKNSGVTHSIDASGEKLFELSFGPIGISRADTLQLMVETTDTDLLAVSGYMVVKQCG